MKCIICRACKSPLVIKEGFRTMPSHNPLKVQLYMCNDCGWRFVLGQSPSKKVLKRGEDALKVRREHIKNGTIHPKLLEAYKRAGVKF